MGINQYVKKPLSVDALIEDNGNWFVAYVYCNWGLDHVLMLLPRFDSDPDEGAINDSCMRLPDGSQEEAYMINQWIKSHPETPFLVCGCDTLKARVAKMEDLLAAYNGDWDKFIDDSIEFDNWRRVAHYVYTNSNEAPAYKAWYEGWESLKEEAGCKERIPKKNDGVLMVDAETIILTYFMETGLSHIHTDNIMGLVSHLKNELRKEDVLSRYKSIVIDCDTNSIMRLCGSKPGDFSLMGQVIWVKRVFDSVQVNCNFFLRDLIKDYIGKKDNQNEEG